MTVDEETGEVLDEQPTPESPTLQGAMRSATIGKLAEALAKAQSEIAPVRRVFGVDVQTSKGSYHYSYADLAACWEAARGPLTKNGIAASQDVMIRDGNLVIRTEMMHSSGEWKASEFSAPLVKGKTKDGKERDATTQEVGSQITYTKRYTLCGTFMIVPMGDDDDASSASGVNADINRKKGKPAGAADKPGFSDGEYHYWNKIAPACPINKDGTEDEKREARMFRTGCLSALCKAVSDGSEKQWRAGIEAALGPDRWKQLEEAIEEEVARAKAAAEAPF